MDSSALPLVSIIMPAFNEEKHIESAIRSMQNQDYTNLEILVIDNGSKDRTAEIVAQMAAADSRIRLLHCSEPGPAFARNMGLKLAQGAYIATMDADDDAAPHRIRALLLECQKHPLAVVGSACNIVNPQGEIVDVLRYPADNASIRKAFGQLWNRSVVMPGTCMITADLFKRVAYLTSMRYLEDWDMILRMADDPAVVFVNLPDALYDYKLNFGSVSFDWRSRNRYNLMLLWNQWQRKRQMPEALTLIDFEKAMKQNPLRLLAYRFFLGLKFLQHQRWIKRTRAKLGIPA